jgi:hypothetical protein
MGEMTSGERQDLSRLVRINAKVAKDDADARGKWMLADAEAKLAAVFKAEDDAWADIVKAATRHVAEADAAIAALCRQGGIPEDFRPKLRHYWQERGENQFRERRAELRKVAQTQVAARVAEAKVEIDRRAAQQMTAITQSGLTSEEARAFIRSMPKPEELLPTLGTLELGNGEVFALEAPVPVTQVTDDGNSVTPGVTSAETDKRYKCAFCGGAFKPSRIDAEYCSPAHRVAAHRRRIRDNG